jgi:hypothetical protein
MMNEQQTRAVPAPSRRLSALVPGALALAVLFAAGCNAGGRAPALPTTGDVAMNTLTPEERAEGWRLLFDGQNLANTWRGYRRDDVPGGWHVQNGMLAFVPGGERGDIMTREQFGDFVLDMEWRISEGGNSGIIYRVAETENPAWHTGPEMQILDDERHPDANQGVGGNRKAGSLYDMIPATPGVVRPAGQWNHARVIARANRLEHWLNGQRVVAIDVGSDEWNRLYQASKFSEMPGFGRQPRGHIVLQDHSDPVWFRNIKIRPL